MESLCARSSSQAIHILIIGPNVFHTSPHIFDALSDFRIDQLKPLLADVQEGGDSEHQG